MSRCHLCKRWTWFWQRTTICCSQKTHLACARKYLVDKAAVTLVSMVGQYIADKEGPKSPSQPQR